MKPTTFHIELTGRELGLLQDALNAMITDCDAQLEAANKRHKTTNVAYFTRQRVMADMLHDKLHAALHAPAVAATPLGVTVTREAN